MKRVLFVDDEPRILEGLKRMLRPHRNVWEMVFVNSGDEALAVMSAEPFDVLVTDMMMPGMDGASLLKEVQARHPRTVRMILSGHSDLEASMRSVSVSHQFLTKPCEADVLKEVIERACDLERLLSDPALQSTLGEVGELPVLPKTYRALNSAIAEAEVDMEKVGAIVEQDPAIAAKILQLVNSSFFGVRREISSVRQATSYLGVNTIRDLTLSFEVFRQFEASRRVSGFSIEQEQSHSLMAGRIARRLLPEKKASDQAFLAAMLHDIGKLALAVRLPTHLTKTLEAGAGTTTPSHLVEESLLGVTHAQIGAYLLGLWGMPYPVVEAVAFHHQPSLVAEHRSFGVLGAVHVADALAREVGGGPAPAMPELDLGLLERLGVSDKLCEWRSIALEEAGFNTEAA